jgi:hypothetical protein
VSTPLSKRYRLARRLGVPEYEQHLAENRIDPSVLPSGGTHAGWALANAQLECGMNRMLIAVLTSACMVSSANAAMNRIEKSQQLKKLHNMYLQGVRDGLLTYNRQLETDTSRRAGGKAYFCLPSGYDLTIDKIEKLTSRKANSTTTNVEDNSNFDERYDVSFPRLLLAKLRETYPCK